MLSFGKALLVVLPLLLLLNLFNPFAIASADLNDPEPKRVLMSDQRQLNRWGINDEKLPPDSVVRYKEFSTWHEHRWQIIGLIAVGLILISIIFLLWVQWAKRKNAEERAHRSEVK